MQAERTDHLLLATRRYSTLAGLDDGRRPAVYCTRIDGYDIPAAAWLGLADRLISEALRAMLRGDRMQFVVDRVNDCYRRANSSQRWRPSIRPVC